MKKTIVLSMICMLMLCIVGCAGGTFPNESDGQPLQFDGEIDQHLQQQTEEANPNLQANIHVSIDGRPLTVHWEDNQSVEQLIELLQQGTITIQTQQYGGFEQVGRLPQSITSQDVQMTTQPGDIVLYASDSIVLFYGSNTWAYTKLGHIQGISDDELRTLLQKDQMMISLSLT